MKPCVYILTNSSNSVLYIGVTSDLQQRILQHQNGQGSEFTMRYNLRKLIFCEYHPTMMSAIEREKQLKSWSRSRKVALIKLSNPKWQELSL